MVKKMKKMNKFENDKIIAIKFFIFGIIVFVVFFSLSMALLLNLSECSDDKVACILLSVLISTMLTSVSLIFKAMLGVD